MSNNFYNIGGDLQNGQTVAYDAAATAAPPKTADAAAFRWKKVALAGAKRPRLPQWPERVQAYKRLLASLIDCMRCKASA